MTTPMKLRALLVTLLAVGVMTAQESSDRRGDRDLQGMKQPSATVNQAQGIALESTVDPRYYFIGPSDVIAVNIWMSPPQTFNLNVTPEGTLIIPTVGEIPVSGISLAEAKDKIYAEVKKKYLTAPVTATLVRPRPLIVSVVGSVLREGLYELAASDRANRAVDLANTIGTAGGDGAADRALRDRKLREMSDRSIVLRHRDGTEDRVDLVKYQSTGDDRWNPYLREGDVIVVPRKSPDKNVFGVYGEVNVPGRYELVEGDSLFDAIRIAKGFTRTARTDSVEFSRLSPDGHSIRFTWVNLDGAWGDSLNIPLEPGDRIVVQARRDLREDYRATISGEVVHPGTYPITKDRSTLSEILRHAGGFTEFAALKSATLNRRSVEPDQVETERLLSIRGGLSPEDSVDYLRETALRLHREVVNVDFYALFTEGDSAQDVILRNGDEIVIPSLVKTIYLFGQIVSPGNVPYVPGEDVSYYIDRAGGLTDRAREGDIQIIKGKTKQWLSPDRTQIEEGDYIWVPKEPDRSFSYYMTVGSQAASILSVVLGIGILISQVTK